MKASQQNSARALAVNRKALRDYHVVQRFEAGVELQGTEVKSIRGGNINLTGAFAKIENGEVILHGMNIAPYESGNRFNHDPLRARRLLLHKTEIRRLLPQVEQKGFSLVPTRVFLRHGLVKIELSLCKGKREYDKREDMRRRTADREARQSMR